MRKSSPSEVNAAHFGTLSRGGTGCVGRRFAANRPSARLLRFGLAIDQNREEKRPSTTAVYLENSSFRDNSVKSPPGQTISTRGSPPPASRPRVTIPAVAASAASPSRRFQMLNDRPSVPRAFGESRSLIVDAPCRVPLSMLGCRRASLPSGGVLGGPALDRRVCRRSFETRRSRGHGSRTDALTSRPRLEHALHSPPRTRPYLLSTSLLPAPFHHSGGCLL